MGVGPVAAGAAGVRRRRHRRWTVGAAAAAIALVGAGCIPEPPVEEPPAEPPVTSLSVSTAPAEMFPEFSPDVSDYVVRCANVPFDVRVEAPDAQPISVGGNPAQTGRFTVSVWRAEGQRFTIVDQGAARTYSVRCLPGDFPEFTVTREGTPQAGHYLIAPIQFTAAGFQPTYAVVFDAHGVPVWWSRQSSIFLQQLPNGNLAWTRWNGEAAEEIGLDGSVITTIEAPHPYPGTAFDFHDMIRLANGNYMIVLNEELPNQDLSIIDPSLADVPVFDHRLVEIDPATGDILWSWLASDHIDVAETDPQWYGYVRNRPDMSLGTPLYDIFHWNSVEETPTGYLLSFRHLDAVYAIERATGDVEWKLGGVDVPGDSLVISGDSRFPGPGFGGQHDARYLPGASATQFEVTLYDNGSDLAAPRTPRALRYIVHTLGFLTDRFGATGIDTVAGTATLVEEIFDLTHAPVSPFAGSARRLAGGNWMIGFGGTNGFSETTPSGEVVFHLSIDGGQLVYRALPAVPGLDPAALRAGMDAQHP